MGSQQASAAVLSDRVVEFLRSLSQERTFSAGATVIERGEPGRAFYVVSSGEVEIRLVAGAGQYLSLARLGPGSSFGEMALPRRSRRPPPRSGRRRNKFEPSNGAPPWQLRLSPARDYWPPPRRFTPSTSGCQP